ncbi:ribosomal protein S18-alanine N-acetyltransferase [Tepidiforma thermophila]|uniref:Ribosomal-protein-alanine N-acetyltransferase n=1 Tax=Tepidiforma thermophila (strain KCTC 52669 / CGMCC 1.13589 / G233) TaxID=2761530 RepID=A0A2A9HGC6_TEPT2|nr:ribosomal protein S18-alanine N-acetyltransferase [Tepidiforma thermophila]PFG74026.1 ribosomal-protein-alanine N-acetyltransferase [Tepidiforma thermophila]
MPVPVLEPMQPADIPDVIAVERAAYTAGWPTTAFERELTANAMARYLVVRADSAPASPLVAFGGLWLMVDQAHIVTVAVRPELQRRGYGRLVLHGLIELANAAGMDSVTLEVRVSNDAARALYRRYGFYEVGVRKRYYADNREDAIIMTTEALASPAYQQRLERLRAELAARFPGGFISRHLEAVRTA